MARSGLAKYSTSFVAMVVAGYFLGTWLDRHFAPDEASYEASAQTVVATAPCVTEDGLVRNDRWSIIPALSAQCGDARSSVD